MLDDATATGDGRTAEALAGLDPLEQQQVLALTGGRLGYAVLVSDALRQARRHGIADPVGALTEQLLCGSALERRLRLSYEVRLQRARGYGALRAILDVLAEQQPLTLTHIAQRLHRTPGSTKDYLSWMLDVDLLTVDRKRYTVTDPLLRLWVRLNNGADVPTDAQVARETQRYASERLAALARRTRQRRPAVVIGRRHHRDRLSPAGAHRGPHAPPAARPPCDCAPRPRRARGRPPARRR